MKNVMHGDRVMAVIRTEEREVAEPQELVEQSILVLWSCKTYS